MIVFHALGLALGPTAVRCKDGATILFTCKSSAPQHDIPRRDEVDLSTVGSCKMMKVFPAQASVGETWRRCARTCARTQERQGSNSPGKPHTRVKERHLRLRVRHGSGAHECDAVSQKKNELLVRNGACACLKQVTLTAGNLQAENESFATVAAPFHALSSVRLHCLGGLRVTRQRHLPHTLVLRVCHCYRRSCQ